MLNCNIRWLGVNDERDFGVEPQVHFRYGGWFHAFEVNAQSLSGNYPHTQNHTKIIKHFGIDYLFIGHLHTHPGVIATCGNNSPLRQKIPSTLIGALSNVASIILPVKSGSRLRELLVQIR